jgi:hypothetical protein
MPRFVLIGLCEPQNVDDQPAFDEWFINQHIEDTAHCPHMIRGSVFKLSGPHLDIDTASGYLSLYEVEAPSYEEAERVLNAWQADPDAWAGRRHHLETGKKLGGIPMAIRGSGWYELIQSYEGPAADSD